MGNIDFQQPQCPQLVEETLIQFDPVLIKNYLFQEHNRCLKT